MTAESKARVRVDEAVWRLRPDAAVVVLAVDGLRNGPSDARSDALLDAAEAHARALPDAHADHVAAWREAYRSFGAKPGRNPSSVEALLRRARSEAGLPRVNRLVDAYNAVSVRHGLPVGGEDSDRLVGVPRLLRARGDERFETTADGADVIEHPAAGEVVWADDLGVTCRRWNWRQGVRSRLGADTTRGLFVLERLEPFPLDELEAAADALASVVLQGGAPGATVGRARLGPLAEGAP